MQIYKHIKDNKHLKLSVAHRDSGLTARGSEIPKGVIVSFTVVERDGMWETCKPYAEGNYNVQAVVYKRKNQKVIDKVELFVIANQDKLFDFWSKNLRVELVDFIRNGCNDGSK